MSQYGMQMPGGMQSRGPSMSVYTGLLLIAVVCMVAACAVAYTAAARVAPKGDVFSVHLPGDQGKPAKIELAN
jgi:hypothetical protein